MTGIEMMMKQFGIDPEKIKAEFAAGFQKVMERVESVEKTQTRIEQKIDGLIAWHLSRNPEVEANEVFDETKESGHLDSLPSGHGAN